MYRPRIAIPEIHQDVSNYTNAMYAAGMNPIVASVQSAHSELSSQKEYMDWKDVRPENFDGLVLPGGGDIDPQIYGEENHGSVSVDPWVDTLQMDLLRSFLRHEKPVFGICRGLQVINVCLGGTLIQDMEDTSVHMCNPRCKDQVHACRALKGSWIEELYGESFSLNSNHHQAIRRLGEGLVCDGFCPLDEVVESFHHVRLPIYRVQWHPERMCLSYKRSDTVDGISVFRYFCALCCGETAKTDALSEDFSSDSGMMSDGLGL